MAKPKKEQSLEVKITKDGVVSITIGIESLAFVFTNSDYGAYMNVKNVRGFAKDVLTELLEEREDGSTPVHLMLDQACLEAVENGSENVEDLEEG